MKYGDLTLGQIEAVVNKLGGMDGVRQLLRGEMVIRRKSFLLRSTVKLGGPQSISELNAALAINNWTLGDWARTIMQRVVLTATESELDIIVVTLSELGLDENARWHVVCRNAEEFGFQLCPAEAVLRLCAQGLDLQPGEDLLIGMAPLVDASNQPRIFEIHRLLFVDQKRLSAHNINAPTYNTDRIVFVRPRKRNIMKPEGPEGVGKTAYSE